MKNADPYMDGLLQLRDEARRKMWAKKQAQPTLDAENDREQERGGPSPGVQILIGGREPYGVGGAQKTIAQDMDDHDEDDAA